MLWDAQAARALEALLARPDTKTVEGHPGDGTRMCHGLTSSPSPVSSRSTKRRLVSITRHWWETFQICPFKHVETDSPEVDSDFFTHRRRWFGLRLRRPGGLEWASSRLRFQFAFWCWQVSHSILSCVVSWCNLSLWIKEYRMILFQLNLRHLFRLNLPICFAGLPLFLLLINPCAFVSSLLSVFKISHAFSAAECCRLGTDGRLRLKLEMRCGQWLARKWPAWSWIQIQLVELRFPRDLCAGNVVRLLRWSHWWSRRERRHSRGCPDGVNGWPVDGSDQWMGWKRCKKRVGWC